jgi:hypothetical protein
MRMLAARVFVLVGLASAVHGEIGARVPTVRTDEAPAPGGASGGPRRGPRDSGGTAVCQDRSTKRCWVAATDVGCRAPGEIYRVVTNSEADVRGALSQCREHLPR